MLLQSSGGLLGGDGGDACEGIEGGDGSGGGDGGDGDDEDEGASVAVEAESSVGGEVKARGEATVRASGLTYFIVRPTKLNDNAGGFARITLSQERLDQRRTVSRADLAEVVVRSLLDPRACNVACSIAESDYSSLRGEPPQQDISKLLEVMQPNRV